MTDLLKPPAPQAATPASSHDRSLTTSAVLAGLLGSGAMLALCAAVALAGWFGADAGRYGDTRDAVRVGANAWLLAHGGQLHLGPTTVTLLPLGLTLLCLLATFRSGRWAARRSGETDNLSALSAVAILTVVYGLVALLVALLAARGEAESSLPLSFVGGCAVAFVGGGAGLLVGSGRARSLRRGSPPWVRSLVHGTAMVLLLVVAASSVLLGTALVMDFGAAATVLSRLHLDGAAGLTYTVVCLAFVPNAILLAGSYLLGPGFAVGAGTVVSPTAVVLGPVPAFPLLAALPSDGATPAWTTWLLGVPVLLAAVGTFLAGRVDPTPRLVAGATRGLGAGLLAALVLTALVVLAGGSAGPGRMALVGAAAMPTLTAAAMALAGGGMLGGLVSATLTWWRRRPTASTAGTATD